MKIIYTTLNENLNINEELTCCIGNFDGIHQGHQKLIYETLKYPNNCVITFNPHPKLFLDSNFKQLLTLQNKILKLEKYNIDYLIILKTDINLLKTSPLDFINWLKNNNFKRIIVGNDFKFGYLNKGDINLLKQYFIVNDLDLNNYLNQKISSTLIKEYLSDSLFNEVKYLLGYDYFIDGLVVNGDKIGRTIGYPTANIKYDNNIFIPKDGVYIVQVKIEDDSNIYDGMLNIGHNPTLNFKKDIKLEVYILNFNKNIYNKKIKVIFKSKIRNEIKFNNKFDLINQMNEDKQKTIEYFKKI